VDPARRIGDSKGAETPWRDSQFKHMLTVQLKKELQEGGSRI